MEHPELLLTSLLKLVRLKLQNKYISTQIVAIKLIAY